MKNSSKAFGFETETLCPDCVGMFAVRTIDDELKCPNCGLVIDDTDDGTGGGTDPATRTRRYGALLKKTVSGLALLLAFLLFVVADRLRVLLQRRAD
jgi:hypothetical protein